MWNVATWNAGPGGTPPPWVPPEALDILQWLDAHLNDSADLANAFPGGFHLRRGEPDIERPYLICDVISEVPAWTTELLYSEAITIQFTIISDSIPESRRLRTLLTRHPTVGLDRVEQSPLGPEDAVVTALRTGGTMTIDPEPSPQGGEIATCTIDYLFLVSRGE